MIRTLASLASLVLCLTATSASAVILDFEDPAFSGGLLPPPNDDLRIDDELPGYGPAGVGLVWGPVAVLDVPGNFGPGNFGSFPGFYNGVNCVPPNTSGPCNGAYNLAGAITTTISATGLPFDVGGFNLTSTLGSQRVRITGLVSGVPSFEELRTLNATDAPGSTLVTLNWSGLTALQITVVDGAGNPVTTPSASWIMDNMNVTAVPEPQTWAMFLAGLLSLFLLRRQRASAQ